MKRLAIIILMLAVNSLFAQDEGIKLIDSLKIELTKAKADTTKVNILNQMTSGSYYERPKIAAVYGLQALLIATKINWEKGIATTASNLGICYWVDANFAASIKYFQKSLVYNEKIQDQQGIANALNHLGLLNLEIKKYNQAFNYFFKAYKVNQITKDKVAIGYNLGSIAKAFYQLKNYQKAIEYYSKAREIYQILFDKNGQGDCYNKIAKIYEDQKQYDKAIEYYEAALRNFDDRAKYFLTDSYLGMGRTYYNISLESQKNKAKNLDLSLQYLKKALNIFTEFGTFDKINECHEQLHKAYKDSGNYKLALEHFEKFVDIKESILSYKNEAKIGEMRSQKLIELRNKQIEIQKLKIKSDSRKLYLLVTITFATVILLVLFLNLYVSKKKSNILLLEKNEEISNINRQKDKFFSIIAHDLRGPFSGFLGLTELLVEDIDMMDKEDIQFTAINMRSSAYSLSGLLDNLLEWSRMEQGLIQFQPKYHNLSNIIKECTTTLRDASNKKDIIIENSIDNALEIYADRNIVQSVFRNILSNAIKFTPKEGAIKIKAKEDADNTIISISDTGIGMNAKMVTNAFQLDTKINRKGTEDEPSSGLGLILCKEFIEKHDGKIWIESEENKGTTFHLSFPKKPKSINAPLK
ncbi:tetratricopeptide repeat-containing sensor histidine kinase [Flavobacterium sp.]|uniref:tetratricopeptide repeat-containing sensor histidine kinase n=1 Tax=Flavobacterium sp. TaxID=239 RepID=UPI002C0D1692|nr:tetratricopeptide repeat protein [Flavobacterium sp.]HSD09270.1 tetratricopeptide repeat protein [Flavobacterium sp.]